MLMVWSKVLLQVVMYTVLKFPGFSFSLPIDTTFTLTNVISALETVQKWRDLCKPLGIPFVKRWQRNGDTLMNYYLNSCPGASWSALAGALYYNREQTALTKVSSYFQKQPGMCGSAFRSTLRN